MPAPPVPLNPSVMIRITAEGSCVDGLDVETAAKLLVLVR